MEISASIEGNTPLKSAVSCYAARLWAPYGRGAANLKNYLTLQTQQLLWAPVMKESAQLFYWASWVK